MSPCPSNSRMRPSWHLVVLLLFLVKAKDEPGTALRVGWKSTTSTPRIRHDWRNTRGCRVDSRGVGEQPKCKQFRRV